MGMAASAGADIFMVAEERLVTRRSRIMVHRANLVAIFAGDQMELRKFADRLISSLESFDSMFINDFAEMTTLSGDEARDAVDAETWYNRDQALEIKLATGQTNQEPEDTQNKSAEEVKAEQTSSDAKNVAEELRKRDESREELLRGIDLVDFISRV